MKKRFLTLWMVAVLAFGMPVTAFAEENTYSVTIIEKGGETHTYNVFQIFTGDVTEENGDKILSNIKWGANVGKNGITIGDKTYQSASEFAEYLKKLSSSDLAKNTNDILKNLENNPYKTIPNMEGAKVDSFEAGYYLFQDTGSGLSKDATSDIIMGVIDNTTITTKVDTVISEKKVDDINDSTGQNENLQDSADYDIGDDVPFTLIGTIPENYASYSEFEYVFHDTMDESLTLNDDIKVYLVDSDDDLTLIDKDYTIENRSEHAFDLKFANLKKLGDKVTSDKKIVVKYTARLNEKAKIGSQGNKNKSYISYKNEFGVERKTPEDTVIVFTYKVVINKVTTDTEGQKVPLEGAEFTLKKGYLKDGKIEYQALKTLSATPLSADGKEIKEGDATPVASYTFSFEGIDDGKYLLEETKTPAGYNTMEPVPFEVKAIHSNENQVENSLKITERNGFVIDESINLKFTPNTENGSLTADVINQKGSLLPSTGGMGTTVFYVVGGLLIFGAGIVLFMRKRMSQEK